MELDICIENPLPLLSLGLSAYYSSTTFPGKEQKNNQRLSENNLGLYAVHSQFTIGQTWHWDQYRLESLLSSHIWKRTIFLSFFDQWKPVLFYYFYLPTQNVSFLNQCLVLKIYIIYKYILNNVIYKYKNNILYIIHILYILYIHKIAYIVCIYTKCILYI